jgi:hypothetical protein
MHNHAGLQAVFHSYALWGAGVAGAQRESVRRMTGSQWARLCTEVSPQLANTATTQITFLFMTAFIQLGPITGRASIQVIVYNL